MSQNLPPHMQGQVETPNPLELFWEQHQGKIKAVLYLLVLGLASYYGLQKWTAYQEDLVGTRFTEVVGMEASFTKNTPGSIPLLELDADLSGVDVSRLEGYIQNDAKNTEFEPWAAWVAAKCYVLKADWDNAERWLQYLKSNHPTHYLCAESAYPPQVREEKDKDKKDKGKEDKPKKGKPELEPAKKGNLVDNLLASVQANRQFRKDHPELFIPVEPQGRTVQIKFDVLEDPIEVVLYEKVLPKHTAALVDLIQPKEGKNFFEGQKVYQVTKSPTGAPEGREPQTIHFGLAITRDEAASTKWAEALKKPSHKVMDFPTGPEFKKLHFFPGMLAAAQAKDGKTSINRLFLTANDCSGSFDGEYVILGKVTAESLERLKQVMAGVELQSADQERLGVGQPSPQMGVKVTLKQ